jgi:hypothetical protein
MDFTKKVLNDFRFGFLCVITLGGFHYITICREHDKILENMRKENEINNNKITP